MQKIAKFEKVSKEQFEKDWINWLDSDKDKVYENLKTPVRATKGSAGYDFFAPCKLVIEPGRTVKIPTGIRCKISEGWVLMIVPRSSLGFKYRLQLDNTVGIIDSDYYDSSNEGHIFLKLTNDSSDPDNILFVEKGDAIAQGLFLPFGITEDDDVSSIRDGGFGSTNKK